jgi:hypothetical protein
VSILIFDMQFCPDACLVSILIFDMQFCPDAHTGPPGGKRLLALCFLLFEFFSSRAAGRPQPASPNQGEKETDGLLLDTYQLCP